MALEESVRIRLYGIKNFGYFKRREDTPTFGSVSNVLADLYEWTQGKKLNQTATHDSIMADNIQKTYCRSIELSGEGDYLISTWNETSGGKGTVASIAGDEPFDRASVNIATVPNGSIPGYATYFWFLPSCDKFASVSFRKDNRNGSQNLREYLINFMKYCAPSYVVRESTSTQEDITSGVSQVKILGHSENNGVPISSMTPKFDYFLHDTDAIPASKVKNERHQITKIHYRTALSYTSNADLNILEKISSKVGRTIVPRTERSYIKLSYDFPLHHPSEEEIDEIVRAWKDRVLLSDNSWENVGFEMSNQDRITWLSNYVASDIFSLPLRLRNSETTDSRTLLDLLTERKGQILNELLSYRNEEFIS